MPTPASPPRQPGRPRSREADDAILRAALELLSEHKNVAAISVEAIAARAGVGKATIYRRWSGKEDLYTDAVAGIRQPLPEAASDSARDDLVTLMTVVCADLDNPLDRAVGLLMISDTHPGIAERIHEHVFAPRGDVLRGVLRRGIDTGELCPGTDPEVVLNLLVGGAQMYRKASTGLSPRERAERLVDTVLRGIGAADTPRA